MRYVRLPVVAALLGCSALPAASQAPTPVPPPSLVARGSVPPAAFADPERAAKLRQALPEIERLFDAWVERQRFPGAVMGVLIDGQPVLVRTAGVRHVASGAPVTPRTVFRIASMTKSFTALAILELRDQGRLSLDDDVARYVPELATLGYPSADAPVLTIRHLLTHAEGFPEDNPWGDRQLAQPDSVVTRWLREGIPFSTVPGLHYEYSNYGFAILGRIVQQVSGLPYAEYLQRAILAPLGMTSTTLAADAVPDSVRAHGYRLAAAGYQEEVPLGHGAFGAMGGLWTSIEDLARYVGFQMDAWPPRDDAERGPVRRASVREMQQPWRPNPAFALRSAVDAPLNLNAGAYGYGLRITQTCTLQHAGHGGGLPGYGSLMRWLPEHGVGFIAMANLTYASFAGFFDQATSALEATGALQPRVVQPGPELLARQREVARLVTAWSDSLAQRIAADNLFLDQPIDAWRANLASITERHGACRLEDGIEAENALRGAWRMPCERGWVRVGITLSPTRPARVQALGIRSVLPPSAALEQAHEAVAALARGWDDAVAARLAAPALDAAALRRQLDIVRLQWGPCQPVESIAGDGRSWSTERWRCERGELEVGVTVAPESGQVTRVAVVPSREQACAQ